MERVKEGAYGCVLYTYMIQNNETFAIVLGGVERTMRGRDGGSDLTNV
jgi:hypothetical protein